MKSDIISDFNIIHEFNEWKYKKTHNPLYVWESMLKCCTEKESLPDWILDYLHGVAKKLLDIDNPQDKAAYLVKNALGFKYGKFFSQYHKESEKKKIFIRVLQERSERKRKRQDRGADIYSDVGREFGLDSETVRKYFYEVKHEYDAQQKAYEEIVQEEQNRYRELN